MDLIPNVHVIGRIGYEDPGCLVDLDNDHFPDARFRVSEFLAS